MIANLRRLALLVVCLACLPVLAVPAHYIVVREDAQGALSILYSAVVEMAGTPRLAATRDWNGDGNRLERRIAVRTVLDGLVLHETDVADARWLRGEFGDNEHAAHIPKTENYYVVRIPLSPRGSRALIDRPAAAVAGGLDDVSKRGGALLEVDLDALAGIAARPKASASDVFPVISNGDPANRLDLLVIGDGYTADQKSKFQADALAAANSFLNVSPYSDYRNLVNVTGLFVASNQAGATKPSCAETPTAPVVSVDTALKARYCSSGIRRLITIDNPLTLAAAAVAPNWDKILVLVNDSEYGGSGGSISVASLHPQSVGIMQHEFGHSFTLLADEYETPFPGFPTCSDAGGSSPCELNVTNVTAPLKWSAWVTPGTPIPTTTAVSGDNRAAGAWAGARYLSSGMYRQCFNGLMRTLGTPFCKVDSEAYVKRLYASGWGVPSGGISNIEPATATPGAGSVNATTGTTLAMSARVLGSSAGVTAVWRVDGSTARTESLASGANATYNYLALAGAHTVTLTVSDASSFLLTPHSNTLTWQVQASGSGTSYVLTVAKAGAGSGSVVSSPGGISCGPSCQSSFTGGSGVTLTATPAGDSTFAGWSGGGCSGTGTCTVTLDAATTVTATFNAAAGTPLNATPNPVAFGGQSMRTTAPSIAVTITNPGTGTATVTSVSTSAPFAVTHNCASLAAGTSCRADVTFTPEVAGALSGTLSIASSAGTRSVALSGTGEKSLVTHYYRSILRRAPDAGGKAYWDGEAARVQGLGMNVNEVWFALAGAFFTSPEYLAFNRDNAGFVSDLYGTFFNRAPDSAGLAYWQGLLDQGLPREVGLAGFMFSPEFASMTAAIFGNTTVRREIDTLTDFYRGLLARLPDDAGFTFWLQRFRAAQCSGGDAVNAEVESISSQFAQSAEYGNRARSNAQYVGDLYNAFLRRGGDLDGVRFWINQVASGAQTREQVRRAFVGTPEFQGRVSGIISQGCLR